MGEADGKLTRSWVTLHLELRSLTAVVQPASNHTYTLASLKSAFACCRLRLEQANGPQGCKVQGAYRYNTTEAVYDCAVYAPTHLLYRRRIYK